MPTTGLTLELARRWVAPAGIRWRRWALVAAGVLALVISVLGDTAPCSTTDPTVCGPDLTFSVAVVGAFGAVLLVWWWPMAAAACAVVFAVLDLAYDDVAVARVAWPVLAALHVWHVVVLRRERRSVLALAHAVTVPVPVHPAPRAAVSAPLGPRHLAVVALVLTSLVGLGLLLHAEATERAHEARARDVPARVVGFDEDDGTTRIRTEAALPGIPREAEVETLDDYEVGDEVLLRVDPSDAGWAHLTAEPPDPTWWASVALGSLLLAALLAQPLLAGRVRRDLFLAHPPVEGVPVRWLADDGIVAVVCVDRDVVVAELEVVPRPRTLHDPPRVETAVHPGWLVGELRPGGWCAVVTPDGVELPVLPLAALPDLPVIDDLTLDPELEDDLRAWTDAVPESAIPARMPVRLVPSVRESLVGAVVVLLATGAGWWVLGWPEAGWFGGLTVASLALRGITWGVDLAVRSVTVEGTGFTLVSAWRTERVPMRDVLEVRCAQEHVVLEVDDGIMQIGPFGEPRLWWERLLRGGVGPGPSATEVAAAVDHARVAAAVDRDEDAVAVAAEPPGRWRPATGLVVLLLTAIALAVRYVSVFLL